MTRLTIKDIAALAGVSRTTASRVLNQRGEVSPEVRARVEEVIAQTGYRPLASARSLVHQRTGVIGFVVPVGAAMLVADPYFGVLIRGFSEASSRRGVTIALFLTDESGDQETLIEQVIGPRRVDGIIVSAYHTSERLIERLAEFDVPAVTLGSNAYPEVFGSVSVMNLMGGELAGRLATTLGRGPIAMIGGPEDTVSGKERRIGFERALRQAGVPLDHDLYREGDYSRASGEMAMRELVDLKPGVVFVASDTMAEGALAILERAGLEVPRDVAVISFDGLPSSEESDLTTVRQPIVEVADAALDLLLAQIEGGVVEARMLPVELIERGSTA